MATLVCFSGLGGDAIAVEETPEQIMRVMTNAEGEPLLLTRNGAQDGVYINPERIACWYPSSGEVESPVAVRPFQGPI